MPVERSELDVSDKAVQAARIAVAHVRRVALLGPQGTWTQQAALELWPGLPMEWHFGAPEQMRSALQQGVVDAVLLPARTSVVGDTPYRAELDAMLMLEGVHLLAQYARMLGYCLLGHAGALMNDVLRVYAHPVALAEAAPWLDVHLPRAQRMPCDSAGHAAERVAQSADRKSASLGPALAGSLHGLLAIATGIEEGPHNITQWWVVGRDAM